MAAPNSPHESDDPYVGQGSAPLRRAARGSVLNFAGSTVAAIATLGLTVIVTRLLSKSDAGSFFTATSIFFILVGLAQLGTNAGLVYFLSGSRARGELGLARHYMRIAALPVLGVSIALSVVLFSLSERLGELINPVDPKQFSTFVVAMALWLPVASALQLAIAATQGLGTMKVYALVDQVTRPVLQLVLVGLAVTLLGADAAPWAWASAYAPVAIWAWVWWTRLRDRASNQSVAPDRTRKKQFWRFSWPRALAGITQTAMQRFDIILVGALVGLPEAAIYAAATRFLALGAVAARAVSLSVQPLIGESLARHDSKGTAYLYQSGTAWLILATWPLYLLLLTFGSVVLQIFGDGYDVGAVVLLTLCLARLVATGCGMVDAVLIMAGRSGWNLTNTLLAFSVNLGLDLILIPELGILGAAIGWAAAMVLANVVPLGQLMFWFRLHPFGKPTLLAILLSSAAFGGVPLGVRSLVGGGTQSFTVSVVAGVALYAIALWLARGPLQLSFLVEAVRLRGRRGPKTNHPKDADSSASTT